MAILSVQLVFSMVTASILSKLSPDFSVARWILCRGLVRFLHPSDEELRTLTGNPKSGTKGRGRRGDHGKDKGSETFTVPKTIDIQLESAPIKSLDVIPLQFYTEYQWLIDFTCCGMFVYLMTELYYALVQPANEFNLSILWCLLVVAFSLKVMFSLTAIYFRTEESAERILCVVFSFFFLILAMAVLIVDEDTLEFGLEPAYHNFSMGAVKFLESQGVVSAGPLSLLTVRIALAVMCAITGSFLTFPGLRLAKMHVDSLKYAAERPFVQLLLHLNMISPLFVILMWVKPVVRDLLVRVDHRGENMLLDDETFDSLRLAVILVFCLYRIFFTWTYLQSHLNMACDRVEELKKEVGRISAIELQKMVTRVFYYLCVVALQYITPLILLLYCAFMLKTLGDFHCAKALGITLPVRNSTLHASAASPSDTDDSITSTAARFSFALVSLRQVFTPMCFRGLLSFSCWWICTAWFVTSAFGMMYYSYFTA